MFLFTLLAVRKQIIQPDYHDWMERPRRPIIVNGEEKPQVDLDKILEDPENIAPILVGIGYAVATGAASAAGAAITEKIMKHFGWSQVEAEANKWMDPRMMKTYLPEFQEQILARNGETPKFDLSAEDPDNIAPLLVAMGYALATGAAGAVGSRVAGKVMQHFGWSQMEENAAKFPYPFVPYWKYPRSVSNDAQATPQIDLSKVDPENIAPILIAMGVAFATGAAGTIGSRAAGKVMQHFGWSQMEENGFKLPPYIIPTLPYPILAKKLLKRRSNSVFPICKYPWHPLCKYPRTASNDAEATPQIDLSKVDPENIAPILIAMGVAFATGAAGTVGSRAAGKIMDHFGWSQMEENGFKLPPYIIPTLPDPILYKRLLNSPNSWRPDVVRPWPIPRPIPCPFPRPIPIPKPIPEPVYYK